MEQVHAEVAAGALADAGLTFADVDGYYCAGDAPGFGGISMADYLGLNLTQIDATETGGSSYVVHIGHAAAASAAGKCQVALITLAGLPLQATANLVLGALHGPAGRLRQDRAALQAGPDRNRPVVTGAAPGPV